MIGVTLAEIRSYGMVILVGLLSWFVFSGAKDWWVETFPNLSTFWVGVAGILILMVFYKYKGSIPFR